MVKIIEENKGMIFSILMLIVIICLVICIVLFIKNVDLVRKNPIQTFISDNNIAYCNCVSGNFTYELTNDSIIKKLNYLKNGLVNITISG